jgi:hypothetical protein
MDPPNVIRALAGRSLIAITAIAQVKPSSRRITQNRDVFAQGRAAGDQLRNIRVAGGRILRSGRNTALNST